MEKQFDEYNTIFDIVNGHKRDEKYRVLQYFVENNKKKRIIYNKLVYKFLNNDYLDKEELEILKTIVTGDIYKRKQDVQHCKICSENFRFDLFKELSSKLKYWNIGFPTQPYTPFGIMIYLKDCASKKIEQIEDLNVEQLKELIMLERMLYNILKNSDFKHNTVGISVMFNQINVSQLCLHGHTEIILKDIDRFNLGAKLVVDDISLRNNKLDLRAEQQISSLTLEDNYEDGIIFIKNKMKNIRNIISKYNSMKELYKSKSLAFSDEDFEKMKLLSPAPVANVYFLYYLDKFNIIIAPEIFLDFVDFSNQNQNDEFFYCMKYNGNHITDDTKLLKEYAPILRPSIKVDNLSIDSNYNEDSKVLRKLLDIKYEF